MKRRSLTLAAVPLSALLLVGCASNDQDEVRDWIAAVTEAANDRDAPALRASVDDLLATLDEKVRAGELSSAEADRIAEAARSVQAGADLVDQELIDQEAAEEAARLEAERLAAEEAARKAAEEEAAKQAEEAAKKAEEEAKKAAEEAAKDEEKKKDKDDDEEGDG